MPHNLVRLALVVASAVRLDLAAHPMRSLPSAVAAQQLYRRCCLPVTPAPGPGAVVIFKRSFVAAHSPSYDRLRLAVRAMFCSA